MVGTQAVGVRRMLLKTLAQCSGVLFAALLTSCSLVPTPSNFSSDSTSEEVQRCASADGYELAYPAGWYVHPRNDDLEIGECMLFAQEQFVAERDELGKWLGAQIAITLGSECRGSFEAIESERETEIDGFPAWVRHMTYGEGEQVGEPSGYEYFVNLRPNEACEDGRWLLGRTEVGSPGSYAANQVVLDEMMASLSFGVPEE